MLAAIVIVGVTFHSLIAPSTPTPAIATPEPTIPPTRTLITSTINFGTVSINGKPQRGTLPVFFSPRDGSYTLSLDAPPFQSKSCTVTVINGAPQSAYSTSDCEIASGNFPTITANGVTDSPGYVAQINFDGSDLPLDQQNQINALLARSISVQQSTTAPAGSYIATSFKADNTVTSRRITTSLKATATLAASTNFGQIDFGCVRLICSLFSFDLQQHSSFTGMVWEIGVPVAVRWRFTTLAGRAMGDVSFPVADMSETLLAYTPDSGWSLSAQSPFAPSPDEQDIGNADCNTGTQLLSQQLQDMNRIFNLSNPKGIEGCQMNAQASDDTNLGTFIWRFGVLLAADTNAHKLLPSLPIASPAEISAVTG